MRMNLLKRRIAILLAIVCLAWPLSAPVYAAETAETETAESTFTGEEAAAYVEELIQYLSLYARYDSATSQQLCYEALMGILAEHPEMFETAVQSMLGSLDAYSAYLPPAEAEALEEELDGTFAGIGIMIHQREDQLVVGGFLPDTPAETSGLQQGDVIVRVGEIDTAGMDLDTLTNYIRGPIGTTVNLTVTREGVEGELSFTIARAEIHNSVLSTSVVGEGENRAMYMRLLNFSVNSSNEVRAALDRADADGISNIILDLRDNGGGVFPEAIAIASLFVPNGKTIVTEDHKVQLFNRTYTSDNTRTATYQTVILMNENSASASEVLAAALQENGAGVVIGTQSYGKGTVQQVVPLQNGASIKYTAAFYLTPEGNNINEIGISPDIIVENDSVPLDTTQFTEFSYTRVFAEGDSDPEVKAAKEMLAVWGLYTGTLDETFDAGMADAVTAFQSAEGLYPYGVLDLTTQISMYNQLEMTQVVVDNQLDAALDYFGIAQDNEAE